MNTPPGRGVFIQHMDGSMIFAYSVVKPYAGRCRRKVQPDRNVLPAGPRRKVRTVADAAGVRFSRTGMSCRRPPGSDLPDLECLGDGSRVLSFSTDDYFRSAPFFVILVGNRVIPVLL